MIRRPALRLWAVVFWLAVWQAGSMLLRAVYPHGALLLASPAAVGRRLLELLPTASFWRTLLHSTGHILGGFLLACILGVLLAAAAGRFRWVRELVEPLTAAVKAVPVASFVILALLWLEPSKLPLFIALLTVFPPVYLNVLEGISQIDQSLLEMAQVFRVPALRRIWRIDLPAVLPHLRAAVSLGAGMCWKAGTAAEVIAISGGGIGERLYTAKVYFQTPDLFAWTLVIAVVSAGFERICLWGLDRLGRRSGG